MSAEREGSSADRRHLDRDHRCSRGCHRCRDRRRSLLAFAISADLRPTTTTLYVEESVGNHPSGSADGSDAAVSDVQASYASVEEARRRAQEVCQDDDQTPACEEAGYAAVEGTRPAYEARVPGRTRSPLRARKPTMSLPMPS